MTIATENYFPKDQLGTDGKPKEGAKSYAIKPLKPMELAEVNANGWETRGDDIRMNFKGVKALLTYGLVNPSEVDSMTSVHILEVSNKIYQTSLLAEQERKN